MTINTLLFVALALIVFYLGQNKLNKLVLSYGEARNIAKARIHYVSWVLRSALVLLLVMVVSIISDLGFNDFGVFFSSIFAVIGVALFAQWSILSNVTASIIVFFFFPYRVGHQVKILDGDNSVEGRLEEITLFHVILVADNGSTLTYPNAMVFQKAVVIGDHLPTRAADPKIKEPLIEEQTKRD
ncbi:mechanosensitive ion channel domain-containing protein [Agarivorans sp. Alg241-V36]|uniref:mechanosensitive ion channel domain-containing protein n=1 Tax=Agarivorans sp. Alg241-V36 TaxID=2305992 RepID=UPI0013D261B9|nr:mechanosensitive ion channel domain-containing protein [Agarivorans sp. Alg241-V36]